MPPSTPNLSKQRSFPCKKQDYCFRPKRLLRQPSGFEGLITGGVFAGRERALRNALQPGGLQGIRFYRQRDRLATVLAVLVVLWLPSF